MNILGELTKLREWLDRLRPLPPDVIEELSKRYEVRLAHHSTAIEGNTLTQSETEIVLEKGITIAGKSLREHLEVVGHKEALDFVRELANSSGTISERDIRDVHALVMKGQSNRDSGAYRRLNVRAAGTEYAYPDHVHVPEMMGTFMEWLNGDTDLHPVQFASQAHLRFVTIHPFRDGNGRVGRLLLNLLLIRAGYTIAVIPVARRAEYIDALVTAQSGRGDAQILALVSAAVRESLTDTLETCISSESVVARMKPQEIAELRADLAQTGT